MSGQTVVDREQFVRHKRRMRENDLSAAAPEYEHTDLALAEELKVASHAG